MAEPLGSGDDAVAVPPLYSGKGRSEATRNRRAPAARPMSGVRQDRLRSAEGPDRLRFGSPLSQTLTTSGTSSLRDDRALWRPVAIRQTPPLLQLHPEAHAEGWNCLEKVDGLLSGSRRG